MTTPTAKKTREKLLTVAETAAAWGTSVLYPRRLLQGRRIRFVRIGRHVRTPADDEHGVLG